MDDAFGDFSLALLMEMCLVGYLLSVVLSAPTLTQFSKMNDAVGDFSLALLKSTLVKNENTIHSSYSIWTALGMCLVAAKGDTLKNMAEHMSIPGMPLETFRNSVKESIERIKSAQPELKDSFTAAVANRNYVSDSFVSDVEESIERMELMRIEQEIGLTTAIANRIYVDKSYTLSEKYMNTVADIFDARPESVNFEEDGYMIQKDINDFVANTTHNLIPELLTEPFDGDTKIALINALYFKGSWEETMYTRSPGKFNKHIDGGQDSERIGVRDRFRYGHDDALEATLIELPYESDTDRASMLIIFPDEQHKSDITNWVKRKLNWPAITNAVKSNKYTKVDLTMPKFEVESSFELSDVLKDLGMRTPFSNTANFDGMVDSGAAELKISKVIHKAKMLVDQHGTTAAAATAIRGLLPAAPTKYEPPVRLTIDRSFVAVIILRQNDGPSVLPLFTAVINKVGRDRAAHTSAESNCTFL